MTGKRYGYNDHEDGTTVLWESSDGEPFLHIAEIKDWEAFIRWIYVGKSDAWERGRHDAVELYNTGYSYALRAADYPQNPYLTPVPPRMNGETTVATSNATGLNQAPSSAGPSDG